MSNPLFDLDAHFQDAVEALRMNLRTNIVRRVAPGVVVFYAKRGDADALPIELELLPLAPHQPLMRELARAARAFAQTERMAYGAVVFHQTPNALAVMMDGADHGEQLASAVLRLMQDETGRLTLPDGTYPLLRPRQNLALAFWHVYIDAIDMVAVLANGAKELGYYEQDPNPAA